MSLGERPLIIPDHTDDRNIDVRKNIRRRAKKNTGVRIRINSAITMNVYGLPQRHSNNHI